MPPFGKEPSEATKGGKPIPFLTLSHARAPAAKSQRKAHPKAFAAEGPERSSAPSSSSTVRKAQGRVHRVPFQDEHDEDDTHVRKTQKVSKTSRCVPFGAEAAEGESGSDEQSENNFTMASESVFSLGWQSMLTLQKASFWKDNQDDKTGSKKKRAYDNSKRAANASYLNRETVGAFKKSGADFQRLQSLTNEKQCRCPLDAHASRMK